MQNAGAPLDTDVCAHVWMRYPRKEMEEIDEGVSGRGVEMRHEIGRDASFSEV